MVNSRQIAADLIMIAFVIFAIVLFGVLGAINLLPFFFFILGLILILTKKKDQLLILFLVTMVTNNLIPQDKFVLGIIGVQQALGILVFLNLKKRTSRKEYNGKKEINSILLFILVYIIYYSFKNLYFDLFEYNLSMTISRFINFGFLIYVTYLIINRSSQLSIRAVVSCIVFLGVTTFISSSLAILGYYISIDGESTNRFNGFIGNGDANTLALVMVMGISVLLNYSLSFKWKKIFLIPFAISIGTIGLTGSRSGLILLALAVLIFLFSLKNIKKVVKGLFVLSFVAVLIFPLLETNIERLQGSQEEQLNLNRGTSNRAGKWVAYVDFFEANPSTLLRGADKVISISWDGSFLVAHNIYIQIVYNSGIFFLIYYVSRMFRLFYYRKKFEGNILIVLVPLAFGTLFISDYGSILFLIFALTPFYKNVQPSYK